LALAGILFLLVRLSIRPAYWFFRGRHIARQQKTSLEIYDEINAIGVELKAEQKNSSYEDGTAPTSC